MVERCCSKIIKDSVFDIEYNESMKKKIIITSILFIIICLAISTMIGGEKLKVVKNNF